MNIIIILIPLMILVGISIMILVMNKPKKMMKPKNNRTLSPFKRATHFRITLAFIAFLVVITIGVEMMNFKNQSAPPTQKVETPFHEFEDRVYALEEQIMNGEEPDPYLLLEKRTQLIGDTLTIERPQIEFDVPYVYVERKSENDGTIEEALYKPILIVDDHNFSDQLNYALPVWSKNTVTFPDFKKANIVQRNFQESTMLNQFTSKRSQESISTGYGSMSRSLIVHLKVPKDLEIVDPFDLVFYIDE